MHHKKLLPHLNTSKHGYAHSYIARQRSTKDKVEKQKLLAELKGRHDYQQIREILEGLVI